MGDMTQTQLLKGRFTQAVNSINSIYIGHETNKRILERVARAGFEVLHTAEQMILLPQFVRGSAREKIDTIELSVEDLGFYESATIAEILDPFHLVKWDNANKDRIGGLISEVPAEVGPQMACRHKGLNPGEFLVMAMKPLVIDEVGYMFGILRDKNGLKWLTPESATTRFPAETKVLFRFRTI